LYATVGEGTKALSCIPVGQVLNVVGPLGQGFEIVKNQKVLVIAGGLGSAAVMQLCKELVHHNSVDLYLGYKDYQSAIPTEFFPLDCNTKIATEDGSLGTTGLVTTILPKADGYDVIYLCGPLPMYKALLPSLHKHPKVFASFETRMGCGYGVCAGCSIRVGGKMRKVCHDGPVFLMHEVDLDCLV